MRRDPSIDEAAVEPATAADAAEAEPAEGSHGEFAAVLDSRGRVVSCTPGLCSLLGFGMEEMRGREIAPLVASRGISILNRGVSSLPNGDTVSLVELRVDGERRSSDGTHPPGAPRDGDSFADTDPNPVLRITRNGTLLYANRGSWILLASWSTRIGAAVPDEWARMVREALERGEQVEAETRTGPGFIRLSFVPVPERGYVNVYGIDTTRSRRAEEKLRLSTRVLDSARDASMVLDSELRILEVNRGFVTITGRDREEILGEIASAAGVGLDGPEIWAAVRQMDGWEGPVGGIRKDGSSYPAWASIESVKSGDGETQGFIVVLSDMTAIREAENQLFRLAHSDSLTGLANRRAFLDALDRDLAVARRDGGSLAVLRLDLDRFAMVNDDLGTASGDKALCEVARRVQRVVRTGDTVARADGDEFFIVLQDLAPAAVEAVSAKVRQAVAEPMALKDQEVLVTASAGSASFPGEKMDAAGLLSAAGIALRRAKDAGRNTHVSFSPLMETRTGEQVLLQARLRRALREGELVVHYQPQVSVARGALSGLEALVRWQSGTHGMVSPGGFMPFAEESGQVWEIGEHVLRMACTHGRLWQDEGTPPVQIGVNVSPRQLARPGFVPLAESVLRETGFPPRLLELELTEGALIGDDSEILRKLRDLRTMGISLAIDDFGTRYSTFAYLKRLPVNRLKIDASFVQDMGDGSAGTRIIAAIIAMGHSLKMEVVAEGVETETQVGLLRELGCDHLQGFYFSRPVPAASVKELFSQGVRPH